MNFELVEVTKKQKNEQSTPWTGEMLAVRVVKSQQSGWLSTVFANADLLQLSKSLRKFWVVRGFVLVYHR